MNNTKFTLNDNGLGIFTISENGKQLGEMDVEISGNKLKVYHTEVIPEAEGKGLAKDLLNAMTDHARKMNLKVVPLCPYVNVQFKRHPQDYADLWDKDTID